MSTSKGWSATLGQRRVVTTSGEVEVSQILVHELGERLNKTLIDEMVATAAVMRIVYQSIGVTRELSVKVKLSIYHSIHVPTFIYGLKLWVVTQRVSWRMWLGKRGVWVSRLRLLPPQPSRE